jgi:hypothetical protein
MLDNKKIATQKLTMLKAITVYSLDFALTKSTSLFLELEVLALLYPLEDCYF